MPQMVIYAGRSQYVLFGALIFYLFCENKFGRIDGFIRSIDMRKRSFHALEPGLTPSGERGAK